MKLCRLLILLAWVSLAMVGVARADDTEIFNNPSSGTAQPPNVLIVVDNTANWNTPFNDEIAALKAVVAALDDRFRIGIMMYTETGGSGVNANKGADGAYVRYAMRQMTTTNKATLTTLLNSLDRTGDASNGGKASLAMLEAYLYFSSSASYAGGPKGNNSNGKAKSDAGAFATSPANSTVYSMPSQSCGNNFIIYLSNGSPADNTADVKVSTNRLSALGGNTTSIPVSPNGQQSNVADEWARYMAVSPQSIVTYTIDVLPKSTGQGPDWTALLKSMATQSGGKYYTTSTQAQLEIALNNIFTEVQAINSVFASSTLPVSVNVRGSYLNQVYMGVFRPDANNSPTWAGNLKQYSLAPDSNDVLILVDKAGTAAENSSTGFISPLATSYWTTTSSFWNSTFYTAVQGSGGVSDAPDGDLVEKGGAAQRLRSTYLTNVTTRNLYTCTGACAAGSLLSATPFATTNASITQGLLGTADATTDRTSLINWIRGANTLKSASVTGDNPDGLTTSVRGYIHGDVLHSRPAVINYNRYGNDRDIMVYYGANDGIFHAVKGGQDDADGVEKWGFIPSEFFPFLKRLRDASPIINPPTATKPYFADGPIGIYQYDANNDGAYNVGDGDKVYIYVGMRRGGRFYYALDVSDPDNPRLLWKKSNSDAGFSELGQSWSEPKVASIRLTGQTNPVLIFGAGYDAPADDATPQGTATMGRGVMIVDAVTGAMIWQAGPITPGLPSSSYKTVSGMTYAIPSTMSVLDTNSDGKADRIYAPDTGGNIWRINIHDTDKANWTVTKLAQLGGSGANARKFLFPPDVVLAGTTVTTDTLLIGSGDREHPLDTTIQNRYYMIKDDPALNYERLTPILEGTAGSNTGVSGFLLDVSTNLIQAGTTTEQAATKTALAAASGWYITLDAGEKVVGGSATLAGTTFFGTNKPNASSSTSCTGNLGEARIYAVAYTDGSSTTDLDSSGTLTTADRFQVRPGGGLPPTPVPVSVRINGKDYQAVISGTKVINPTAPVIGRRYRTYWHRLID